MVIVLITLLASNVWAEKYAVLITGDYAAEGIKSEEMWNAGEGKDPEYGFDEFWNDTYLMWEMLREKGYSDENIFVLFAGGQDFQPLWMNDRYLVPENLAPMTDYAADLASVNNVLDGLGTGSGGFPQLQGDDFLFVWTFDHGGGGQDAYLCLMYGEHIWDYEFAALTDQINCQKKVFWMQQFIQLILILFS